MRCLWASAVRFLVHAMYKLPMQQKSCGLKDYYECVRNTSDNEWLLYGSRTGVYFPHTKYSQLRLAAHSQSEKDRNLGAQRIWTLYDKQRCMNCRWGLRCDQVNPRSVITVTVAQWDYHDRASYSDSSEQSLPYPGFTGVIYIFELREILQSISCLLLKPRCLQENPWA